MSNWFTKEGQTKFTTRREQLQFFLRGGGGAGGCNIRV